MRLKDKVALITGGGSGIGQASAKLFADEGAQIVVADKMHMDACQTADQINEAGGTAVTISGDVTDNNTAMKMCNKAEEVYGRLNVLVNAAGITHRNALEHSASEEEIWDKVIDVNLKGTYLMSRHAVDGMKRAGGGAIINLASMAALVGSWQSGRGFDPYPASKAAVLQFSRNLAIDCAKENIRVNSICPGNIDTPLIKALTDDPQMVSTLKSKYPLGRLGRPEEVAYAALYLASDESSFVTGTYIVVDGGFTAQ